MQRQARHILRDERGRASFYIEGNKVFDRDHNYVADIRGSKIFERGSDQVIGHIREDILPIIRA
jgi:hypothetical protein